MEGIAPLLGDRTIGVGTGSACAGLVIELGLLGLLLDRFNGGLARSDGFGSKEETSILFPRDGGEIGLSEGLGSKAAVSIFPRGERRPESVSELEGLEGAGFRVDLGFILLVLVDRFIPTATAFVLVERVRVGEEDGGCVGFVSTAN